MRTKFYYKNHRGDVELRDVDVLALVYVATPHLEYGYQPGLAFQCRDYSRGRDGSEQRTFYLSNIRMEGFKLNTVLGQSAWTLLLDGRGEARSIDALSPLIEVDKSLLEAATKQLRKCVDAFGELDDQVVLNLEALLGIGVGKPIPKIEHAPPMPTHYVWEGQEYQLTGWMTDTIKQPRSGGVSSSECLHGTMHGHKRATLNGPDVTTSRIVAEIAPNVFLTNSGSVYRVDSWLVQKI